MAIPQLSTVDNIGEGAYDASVAAQSETIYATRDKPENWYLQQPYGFKFTDRNGKSHIFYLPIAPSNITINTHFATNVISTMYGTIEEHTEQRYFDITISGTTGMSPRYFDVAREQEKTQLQDVSTPIGRAGYPVKSLLNGNLGGFFKRTQSLVDNALNQANDLLGDDNGSTGIDLNRTGYVAFHNFYKFLLVYKKDVSGESGVQANISSKHPLIFLNYKDNNQYNVAIQGFQLTRDASQPMLYNYNITLRGYNLTTVDAPVSDSELVDRAKELGLGELEGSSLFSKIANKAKQAKNVAYSTIAGIKGFGS